MMKNLKAMMFAMAACTVFSTAAAVPAMAAVPAPSNCILSQNVTPSGERVLVSSSVAELNALDRAGRSAKNVHDLSTNFCYAHGEPVYEVRFSTSEGHYKYTVDAVTGSVMNVFLTV